MANATGIGNFDFQSFGGARGSLGFNFFEQDGVTPVAWAETPAASVPEPSAFWLVAAVLIYCVAVRARPQSKFSTRI